MISYEDYKSQAEELLRTRSYTRASLAIALGISRGKLDMIHNKCSIALYPRALSRSQAATYGRKIGKNRFFFFDYTRPQLT